MVLRMNPRAREMSSTDSPLRKRRSVSVWLSFKREPRGEGKGSRRLENVWRGLPMR